MFSAAVRVGTRLNDWKMNPTRSRRRRVSRRSSSLVRSTSPRWTWPWSTGSRPARQCSRVDARPGGPHHGAEPAAAEADRDAVQRGDGGRPGAVGPGDLDGAGGELDGPGGGRDGLGGRHGRSWEVGAPARSGNRNRRPAALAWGEHRGGPSTTARRAGGAVPLPHGHPYRLAGHRPAAGALPDLLVAVALAGLPALRDRAQRRGRRRGARLRRLAVLAGRAGRPAPGGAGLLGSGPVVARYDAGACGWSTPASTPTGAGPRGPGPGPWRPATASSAWSRCG